MEKRSKVYSISEEEMLKLLKKMKNVKLLGLDETVVELLKKGIGR